MWPRSPLGQGRSQKCEQCWDQAQAEGSSVASEYLEMVRVGRRGAILEVKRVLDVVVHGPHMIYYAVA